MPFDTKSENPPSTKPKIRPSMTLGWAAVFDKMLFRPERGHPARRKKAGWLALRGFSEGESEGGKPAFPVITPLRAYSLQKAAD